MDRTSRTISTDAPAAVSVSAPAKVNLVLRILDRRPDGYHNLWSLMQTVSLADELTVTLDPASPDITLTCSHPDVPLGPTNLIHRAATAVLERAGVRTGLRIELQKRIPMGAGLGGGSSNAAATVLALNRLLHLGWSCAKMAELTAPIGSDVPFFFSAPTAIVSGRGERVRPRPLLASRALLLVNPGFGVETAWAYRALAASRTAAPTLSESLTALAEAATPLDWEMVTPLMANDFETVVFREYPLLAEIKGSLQQAGALTALLSGTGATVFGLFATMDEAVAARHQIVRQPGWQAWAVSTGDGMTVQAVS